VYEFNLAKDIDGIKRGLRHVAGLSANVMAADTSGNIYYRGQARPRAARRLRLSRRRRVDIRRRQAGAAPSSELLQVQNPPQGFMQNCNIPPDAMSGQPVHVGVTKAIYRGSRLTAVSQSMGWSNTRGARRERSRRRFRYRQRRSPMPGHQAIRR
jgi:acyl-homoserine lactone acylase PvdQ